MHQSDSPGLVAEEPPEPSVRAKAESRRGPKRKPSPPAVATPTESPVSATPSAPPAGPSGRRPAPALELDRVDFARAAQLGMRSRGGKFELAVVLHGSPHEEGWFGD